MPPNNALSIKFRLSADVPDSKKGGAQSLPFNLPFRRAARYRTASKPPAHLPPQHRNRNVLPAVATPEQECLARCRNPETGTVPARFRSLLRQGQSCPSHIAIIRFAGLSRFGA